MKAESVDPEQGTAAGSGRREIRTCQVCGTKFTATSDNGLCPVCVLHGAAGVDSAPAEALDPLCASEGGPAETEIRSTVRRFENYEVMLGQDGKPIELGRGAMGVTYKAFDIDLHFPVTLKVISERYIGDQSARLRFLREARAAAKMRHPNVASVFHLGRSGSEYFYAMEFVEGETLENLIKRSGRLETKLGLEITSQVAAGLEAVHEQNLVHRDIKPANIMVCLKDDGRVTAKIIDLGLAKGVSDPGPESGISIPGTFGGTPAFASPEQFAGLGLDIRSDLYSLGVTLWEMLAGQVPFRGSPTEVMYGHQHRPLPLEQLKGLPQPVVSLLQVLLEKDPVQRLQSPAELLKAILTVSTAVHSGRSITPNDLRAIASQRLAASQGSGKFPERAKMLFTTPRARALAWLVAVLLVAGLVILGVNGLLQIRRLTTESPVAQLTPVTLPEKSIAVLPFESLSPNKDDSYFADGVQDEILNNLAKIAQLKVISRTSVMLYRPDAKRDLRQIAAALGVVNVLEGTVRRSGNQVRVTTELIDARNDNTIWAESYDRDLTDIFAIQSEVAQTIAVKLSATLSPAEKKTIEAKPTDNLAAYDLYIRGKALLFSAQLDFSGAPRLKSLTDAADLLEQAVRLDPKFTLAYCAIEEAYDLVYFCEDPTPERLAKADKAVNASVQLEPDLPEVHLSKARRLYDGYRDYDGAHDQLELARRGLPNNAEADSLEAWIKLRQGKFEEGIEKLNEAITRDPQNPKYLHHLALALWTVRQFEAAGQAYDRVIELLPDEPMLRIEKAEFAGFLKNGDDSAVSSALTALPPPVAESADALSERLWLALTNRDFDQASQLIEKMNGAEDSAFAYVPRLVPIESYSVLMSRLREVHSTSAATFTAAREQLNLQVLKSPQDGGLLSQLAVLDALLNSKETAIAEAKRAAEMLPVSKDAIDGPGLLVNLAVVYAWTNELDLAFSTLGSLVKMPGGIYYGQLKREPYWEPLHKDSRYDKLLAELAPKD